MSKYMIVEGNVLRSDSNDWTSDDGKTHAQHKLVLFTGEDRIDVGTPYNNSEAVAKARRVVKGEQVRLQVEVKSGKTAQADPVFVFLDDLTVRNK